MGKLKVLIIVAFAFCVFFKPVFGVEYSNDIVYTEWSPKSVLISPDGKKAYVLNLEACSVTVYDTFTRELLETIYFPQTYARGWDYEKECSIDSLAEKPVEGAFTDNGRYLWISFHNDSSVVVINTEGKGFDASLYANTIEATIKGIDDKISYKSLLKIPVEKTPKIIAVSPDEKLVAVANWHGYSVSIIDAENFKLLKNIPVSSIPRGMVFNKDGSLLYVAIMGGDYLEIIDTSDWKIKGKVENVGPAPRHLVMDSAGKYIYCSVNQAGTIVKIDVSTNTVLKSVNVGRAPRTVEFSPDEKFLYVCCYRSDELYVLNLETFKVADILRTGYNPVGLDVTPAGDIWVANQGDGTVSVFRVKN